MLHKGERSWHVSFDDRFKEKDSCGFFCIHAAIIHTVRTGKNHPAERNFFDSFHKAAFRIISRFKPAVSAKILGDLDNPLRHNFRSFRQKNTARFADFGRKDKFREFPSEIASREKVGVTTADKTVATVIAVSAGHASKESRQKCNVQIVPMERIKRANVRIELDLEYARELFVQIDPFPAPQKMHKMLFAIFAKRIPSRPVPFPTKAVPFRKEG